MFNQEHDIQNITREDSVIGTENTGHMRATSIIQR